MSHKKSVWKPKYYTREKPPIVTHDRHGAAVLNCPFCVPPHPISPNTTSQCGTIVQVRAVQQVYRSSKYDGTVCVKCGKGGGEMVVFQGALIHVFDCNPGVTALATPPQYSVFAKLLYRMKPGRVRNLFETMLGKPVPVEEVDPKGVKTGVIFGYYFFKKRGKNGRSNRESQHPAPDSGKPVPG